MRRFGKAFTAVLTSIVLAATMAGCGSSAPAASSTTENATEQENAQADASTENEKTGGASAEVTAQTDEIKIGMVNPLSGDNALYGLDQSRAMSLAFEEINAAGGIYGAKIVMEEYDDQGDPQNSAKGAQKFADDDSYIAIVGSSLSPAILAMVPIIDDAGIVEMVCSGSSPTLSGCSEYFFRFAPQDVEVGKMIAKGILSRGYTDMVVLYPNNDYGINLSENLVGYAKENGGNVLESIGYNAADQDFTAILTTVKGLKPQAIALCGTVMDSSNLINQIKQLGIEAFLMGGTSLYNTNAVEMVGDGLEGAGCISVYISTNPDKQVQEFVSKYEAAYGETPDAFAAMGYDMAYSFADACKRAMEANGGAIDRDLLRDAMETVNYDGVTGTVTFNDTHDWVRDYLILEYKDGDFVLTE